MNLRWLAWIPLALYACSDPVDLNQLETRQGVSFLKGQKFPYTGAARAYFPTGPDEAKRLYTSGDYYGGRKTGVWVTWKWDGEREEAQYEDGKRDGPTEVFDPHDRKIAQIHYRNGLLHGYSRTYHPETGEIIEMSYYAQGERANPPTESAEDDVSARMKAAEAGFRSYMGKKNRD